MDLWSWASKTTQSEHDGNPYDTSWWISVLRNDRCLYFSTINHIASDQLSNAGSWVLAWRKHCEAYRKKWHPLCFSITFFFEFHILSSRNVLTLRFTVLLWTYVWQLAGCDGSSFKMSKLWMNFDFGVEYPFNSGIFYVSCRAAGSWQKS